MKLLVVLARLVRMAGLTGSEWTGWSWLVGLTGLTCITGWIDGTVVWNVERLSNLWWKGGSGSLICDTMSMCNPSRGLTTGFQASLQHLKNTYSHLRVGSNHRQRVSCLLLYPLGYCDEIKVTYHPSLQIEPSGSLVYSSITWWGQSPASTHRAAYRSEQFST